MVGDVQAPDTEKPAVTWDALLREIEDEERKKKAAIEAMKRRKKSDHP